MREVFPLTHLLDDLLVVHNVITVTPEATCILFEDNQNCIAFSEHKKPVTRTNHIAIKHYHFRILVDKNVIKINCIDIKKQIHDVLTKPIENDQSFKLRFMLMGRQCKML